MPANRNDLAVPTLKLRRICDPVGIETGDGSASELGQNEALASMEVGLQMIADDYARSHYNIVVAGPPNTGRTARSVQFLLERAEKEPHDPHGVIAVHDFDSPRRFIAAFVPQGTSQRIKDMLAEFGKTAAFKMPEEIEDFRERQMQKAELVRRDLFQKAEKQLNAIGLLMEHDPQKGVGIFPIVTETTERPMTKEEFDALNEAEKKRLQDAIAVQHHILKTASETSNPEEMVKILARVEEQLNHEGLMFIRQDEHTVGIAAKIPEKTERALTPEEFEKLDKEGQEQATELISKGLDVLNETMKKFGELVGEIMKGCLELAETHAKQKLQPIRELVGDHEDYSEFHRFLDGLVEFIGMYASKPRQQDGPVAVTGLGGDDGKNEKMTVLHRCEVRILVDNADMHTKPVVHLEVPSYSKLFGRINVEPMGHDALRIDHTMVEKSAILEANGGYLVMNLNDLLRRGGAIAFYKLLEVIRTGRLTIESKSSFVDAEGLINYRSNEIPVDIRVIAVCDQWLEMMLRHIEPEFENLFRITSEFSGEMPIEEAPKIYGQFVKMCREQSSLPPFTPSALAKLVEYGCRRAGDQSKCSTELGIIKDVVTEAAHWARQNGSTRVFPRHIKQAINARFDRRALPIRRYQEFLDGGHLLLTHGGAKTGQINGLAVLGVSHEVMFGIPKRITARCFAGKEKVILVQRKTKQSGSSSNAAVDHIIGYLSGKYGRKKALSLVAQLSFEQTYDGIDGDSATVAEYVAIISAIIERPINQMGAVTGSMNQWGEIQPIGGVNEKIEGHFGALNRRGLLQPGHFVAIPVQNVDNLMLDEEVVHAQRAGNYQVYALSHIDEALELFLDIPIMEIDRMVEEKLAEMNEDKHQEDDEKKPTKKRGHKKPAKKK